MTTDPDRSPAHDHANPRTPSPPSGSSTKALVGVLLAGTVGMVVFLFVHLSQEGKLRTGPAPAHAECTKGEPDCLPQLDYVDTNGVAYKHGSLAGKIVLVNFWATWCRPCEKEIPDLSKMYDKYQSKGVVFLGVVIDDPDSQSLLNFQSDHQMTFPVVRPTRELMSSYNNPDAYPTTFVYDRSGKRVFSKIGALRERELDSLLATLVAQN